MNVCLGWASLRRQCPGSSEWATLLFATCVFLVSAPAPASSQPARDSLGVAAFVEAYRNTWSQHDPSALGAFFTEDADMIMGTDPLSVGRGAVEEWWGRYFERQEPERVVEVDLHSIRLISTNVAVLNVTTTTRGRTSEGQQLQERRARGTWVIVRETGQWHIVAMRGMPTEDDEIIRATAG